MRCRKPKPLLQMALRVGANFDGYGRVWYRWKENLKSCLMAQVSGNMESCVRRKVRNKFQPRASLGMQRVVIPAPA